MIDIIGLDKADVLAALYNASRPQGLGFLHYDAAPMTRTEAADCLAAGTCFDYLKGRVMKVSLAADEFNPWGYDRDNGAGAAQAAINAIRGGSPQAPEIVAAHALGTFEALDQARALSFPGEPLLDQALTEALCRVTEGYLQTRTVFGEAVVGGPDGERYVVQVGSDEFAEALAEAIDRDRGGQE